MPSATTTIAIDFETAGYAANSACAIGMAKVQAGQIVDTFYSLIRPPSARVYFSHIHGLTWPMLKDCQCFGELWPEIAQYIQGASQFVAHNAPFDRRVLQGCCQMAEVETPPQPFVCTLKQSRRVLRLPSHALAAVARHLGIEFTHHHAGEDALVAAKIFLHLEEKEQEGRAAK